MTVKEIRAWIDAQNEVINRLMQLNENKGEDWMKAYVFGATGVLSTLRKMIDAGEV